MTSWRDNPRPVPGVTRAQPVEAPVEHAVCMGCSRRHEGAIAACPHCEKRPGAHGSRFCDACCGAFVCARCGNDHGLCYECHVAVYGDALRELRESEEWKAMQTWIDDRRLDHLVAFEWDDLVELVEGKKP